MIKTLGYINCLDRHAIIHKMETIFEKLDDYIFFEDVLPFRLNSSVPRDWYCVYQRQYESWVRGLF